MTPESGPASSPGSHLSFIGCSWPPPRTNVQDSKDKSFLKSCQFGPKNPYCPIFRLGSLVSWTGSNFQELALQVGGVPLGPKGSGPGLCNEEGSVGWHPWAGVALRSPLPQGFTVFRTGCGAQPSVPALGPRAFSTCHVVLGSWGIS